MVGEWEELLLLPMVLDARVAPEEEGGACDGVLLLVPRIACCGNCCCWYCCDGDGDGCG